MWCGCLCDLHGRVEFRGGDHPDEQRQRGPEVTERAGNFVTVKSYCAGDPGHRRIFGLRRVPNKVNQDPHPMTDLALAQAPALAERAEGRIVRVGLFVDADDAAIAQAIAAARRALARI